MRKIKNKTILIILIASIFFVCSHIAWAETLKIGFVTDWEYGSQKKYTHKYPRQAAKYLNVAVNHFNNIFQPDLVVGGGDYILGSGIKKKKARSQLRFIDGIFQKASAPRKYCIGNHDLVRFSKEEIQDILGIGAAHSVTDTNGFRIITLDTNWLASSQKKYHPTGIVSEEEQIWLEEQLDTNLPVIVFSHHSPVQTPERKKWRTNTVNFESVRSVLEKYGNVIAVFSGHHAINYNININGINYVVINNLTDEKAKGAYADITIEGNEEGDSVAVSVSQYGNRPATYNFSKSISAD